MLICPLRNTSLNQNVFDMIGYGGEEWMIDNGKEDPQNL